MASEILVRMRETVVGLVDKIEVLPLDTPEHEAHAVKICSAVKRLIDEGETERKALVKPYKEEAKKIDAQFREPRRALERFEKRIKERLAEAAEARRRAAEAATREAFSAMREGDAAGANDALARAPEPVRHQGTIERWSWEMTSADVALVPLEFVCVDTAKVKAYLKSLPDGATPEIPGVTFERKVTIGVRK